MTSDRSRIVKRGLACVALVWCVHACFGPVMGWYNFRGWTKAKVVHVLGKPDYDSRDHPGTGGPLAGAVYLLSWRYGLGNGVRLDFDANDVVVNEVQLQH